MFAWRLTAPMCPHDLRGSGCAALHACLWILRRILLKNDGMNGQPYKVVLKATLLCCRQ